MADHPVAPERPDIWPLQDVKARFGEVVRRAVQQGPQHVDARGKPAAVVLSEKTFARLTAKRRSIVDHILDAPPWSDDLVEAINARRRGGWFGGCQSVRSGGGSDDEIFARYGFSTVW